MDRSSYSNDQEISEKRREEARKRAAARRAARAEAEQMHSESAKKPSRKQKKGFSEAFASRSPKQKRSQNTFVRSSNLAFLALVVLCIVIVGRLFFFTVIQGPELSKLAKASRTNVETLLAKRGTIYDRNGNILATSVECKTVYANPHLISNTQAAAEILEDTLGGDAEVYQQELEQDTTFAYIERKVDTTKAEKCVQELEESKIDGIYLLQDMKRLYPYGSVAAQVLGIVGTDGNGLSGIELQYDSTLAGKNGELVMEQGGDGTPIAGGAYQETPSQNGTDIVLSLDINIQEMAEKEITNAKNKYSASSGMVTVADPETGEIYAMCSTPLLDQNNVSNDALSLKNISDAHEPGSVLKILTTAIGEDAGAFTNDTSFTVPVGIAIGDHIVHDEEKRTGTEVMTPRDIMRVSSNVGAVLLGRSIGKTTFREGLSAFGIGEKTGIDYPGENTGIVPSQSAMRDVDLSYMAFGQSLSTSQIQLVRAVNAIGNKGTLTTPHFLVYKGKDKVEWEKGGRACSEQTAQNLIDIMKTVVSDGTAKAAQVPGYEVAAKTGTGEQASNGSYLSSSYLSTLIGFAPASDPKVTVCVSLTGVAYLAAESSAPVFSSIMSEALQDLHIVPDA